MTLWHSYYLSGALVGLLVAAFFADRCIHRYIVTHGSAKKILPSIGWLILMHGIAWPIVGFLAAAFLYFYRSNLSWN